MSREEENDSYDRKWLHFPPTNYEKWCVGKTDEEIVSAKEQRARERHANNPWAAKNREPQHRMSHDEQRDLGLDDQRDLFKDGRGDYGWTWDDEAPQPVED